MIICFAVLYITRVEVVQTHQGVTVVQQLKRSVLRALRGVNCTYIEMDWIGLDWMCVFHFVSIEIRLK